MLAEQLCTSFVYNTRSQYREADARVFVFLSFSIPVQRCFDVLGASVSSVRTVYWSWQKLDVYLIPSTFFRFLSIIFRNFGSYGR